MSYSEVEISECTHTVKVTARGGTRRQRGSAIGAAVRGRRDLVLLCCTYSETYGFQSATYARYRRTV